MARIFKWLLILFLIWLGYIFVYIPADQKAMTQQVASRESTNEFTEGFENLTSVSQLFKKNWSGWHELILQNNEVSLRRPVKHCMLTPIDCLTNTSLGNYVELSPGIRRRGQNALKFYAQSFNKTWFGDSRAALRRHLFNFGKGDDIYFSGWFYFEAPEEKTEERTKKADHLNRLTIASFRSPRQSLRTFGEPGPALFLSFRNYLGVRFDNWAPEMDEAHQDLLNRITMPTDEWVEIKWHLKLSDKSSDGLVEVWLNNQKIIAERTPTLPTPETRYSILELGIGSNLNLEHDQTFYVDNITVSAKGFRD